MRKLKCQRPTCGHEWYQRTLNTPKVCPACTSKIWMKKCCPTCRGVGYLKENFAETEFIMEGHQPKKFTGAKQGFDSPPRFP